MSTKTTKTRRRRRRGAAVVEAKPGEKLYRLAAVAEMVDSTYRTLQRHIRKGALAVVRVGPTKRVRVTESELRRYRGD